MPGPITSATESLRAGNRVVAFGIIAIVAILGAAAVFLVVQLLFGGGWLRAPAAEAP